MTLSLAFPRIAGMRRANHSGQSHTGGRVADAYPISTHANTVAECLEALITEPADVRTNAANAAECVRLAGRDGVHIRYAASWPAADGQSWRFVLIAQRNSARWAERRTLIVNADQYTALVSAMTDLRVPEIEAVQS